MKKVYFNKLSEQSNLLKESLRSIRTNLQFSGDDVKVILFTSVAPDEGKSQLSFDIARSLVENGKKVLFIDTDIRKSVHVSRLGVKTKDGSPILGLSHYLSGQSEISSVKYATHIPGLSVIFSGPVVPNATELLDSNKYRTLIKTVRKQFDYVIVDSPPISVAVDASLIADSCDGVVLIIVPEENSVNFIRRTINQLKVSGTKILGVVLNKVQMKKNSYYGKYYGSYYGKYYGSYYGKYYGRENEKE